MAVDRFERHKREQAQQLFFQGRAAIKDGHKADGRSSLLQALKYDKDHSDAWMWLAATTDDVQEQREYLEHAVAANPGNAGARRGLAIVSGLLKPKDVLPEGSAPAPRAPTEPEQAAIRRTFTCSQCGGRLRFDPDLVDLKCENCGHVEVVDEVSATGEGHTLDLTLPTLQGHRWAEGERRATCQQCGASTLLPVGQTTTKCPFCDSAALVTAPEERDLIPPHALIPMGLTAEKVGKLVKGWLGSGFFAPDDLAKLARPGALRPIYVPFWLFDAMITVKWTAEVQEGSGRYSRWVSRNGERSFSFSDQVQIGVRALPSDLLKKVEPFDLKKLILFKPEYLAGWTAATYDISLSDSSLDAREVMIKNAREQILYTVAPGKTIRNLEVFGGQFYAQTFKHILLPIWLGAYNYQGKTYRLAVNGQTGQVAGDRPNDPVKVWTVIGGAIALVVLIALFIGIAYLRR